MARARDFLTRFVSIADGDGRPVDPDLIGALGRRNRCGLPVESWVDGNVGLVRASLTQAGPMRPSTLDGRTWIVADCRIDARETLIAALVHAGRLGAGAAEPVDRPDEALLLHAYAQWGPECLDHLLGDFSFVIWDGARRRLFGARDQLGVRPFFYARVGRRLTVANELSCLLGSSGVSRELDDQAVADFLLWGRQQDLEATIYGGIRRLPPGHKLVWEDGAVSISRYWNLRAGPEIAGGGTATVEQFSGLLEEAVRDRLGGGNAGVFMSGGLDSTAVATVAKEVLEQADPPGELRAHTAGFTSLIPDAEPDLARLVAAHLEVPIEVHDAMSYPPWQRWDQAGEATPEPLAEPLLGMANGMVRAIAGHSDRALTGVDGDSIFQLWLPSHFRSLARSGRLRRLVSDGRWYVANERVPPPMGLRTTLRRRRQRSRSLPPWLDRGLVERLRLDDRWRELQGRVRPIGRSTRSDAIELLTGPGMSAACESYDPAVTGSPISVAHPLADLRLVEFVLALPPVPWCVDKRILRQAMSRRLPDVVVRRPKAPMHADPIVAGLLRSIPRNVEPARSPVLGRFIRLEELPALEAVIGTELGWPLIRALSLDLWLRTAAPR